MLFLNINLRVYFAKYAELNNIHSRISSFFLLWTKFLKYNFIILLISPQTRTVRWHVPFTQGPVEVGAQVVVEVETVLRVHVDAQGITVVPVGFRRHNVDLRKHEEIVKWNKIKYACYNKVACLIKGRTFVMYSLQSHRKNVYKNSSTYIFNH